MKKRRNITIIALLLITAFFCTDCAGNKRVTYPGKQKKKRKCDCPEWSYNIDIKAIESPDTFYVS